jgi:6-phosphogluconolactonase
MVLTLCPDLNAVSARAADLIVQAAQEAIARSGRFLLVLTGGSTPERAYRLLTQPPRWSAINWAKTYIFFTDERFVPGDDPRSNFGMVRRSLLDGLPIPPAQVFPMPVDSASPVEGAAVYADDLARYFSTADRRIPPRFDLILLGMGDDGHVASLFPGAPALKVGDVSVTWSPPGTLPPPVDRITLTFPVLNAARQVVFLVAGENKAAALHDVLEGHSRPEERPAAGIRPTEGSLTWLVDEAATSKVAAKHRVP